MYDFDSTVVITKEETFTCEVITNISDINEEQSWPRAEGLL